MTAFADLGLSKDALKAVERLEYTNPTPVQEQAIPIVLEGRDLIAAASTGTGKTAAFLLPILSTLPRAGRGKRAPRVLVVTPTRELAQQISFTCIKIARATGHFATTVYGGTAYGPQIRELRGGTDVLIATPGRLKDLMTRGVVDLTCIQTLVLDEADRMLDMGFLPDVTTIVEATPEERQTLLFSATIDKSIENNLGSLLRDPAVVQIAHKGETAATVEQFIMPIAQRDKAKLLRAVLEEKGSERVIVFARTKNRTEDCAEMLRDAGFSAESIHSDKTQAQRRRALENFRRGKADILVATDVLARGIDVTGVDHVINYDLPDMPEDYVHRIGRTGRAGEEGYAISFVSPDTKRLLREVEKLINREIPLMELETYELDPSILTKGGKKGSSKNGSGRKRNVQTDGRIAKRAGAEGTPRQTEKSQRANTPEEFRPNNRKTRRAAQFADRKDEHSTRAYAGEHDNRNDRRPRKSDRYANERDHANKHEDERRGKNTGKRNDNARFAEHADNRKAGRESAYYFKTSEDYYTSKRPSRSHSHTEGRANERAGRADRRANNSDFRSSNKQRSRSFGRTDNRAYVQNRFEDGDGAYRNSHEGGYKNTGRNNRSNTQSFDHHDSRNNARSFDRRDSRTDARPLDRSGARKGKPANNAKKARSKERPVSVSDTRSFGEKKRHGAKRKSGR